MQQSVANDTSHTLHATLDAKDDVTAQLACENFDVEQGYRDVDTYLVGGHMTVHCVDGYTLQGDSEYTCTETTDGHAQWQPEVDVDCKGDNKHHMTNNDVSNDCERFYF